MLILTFILGINIHSSTYGKDDCYEALILKYKLELHQIEELKTGSKTTFDYKGASITIEIDNIDAANPAYLAELNRYRNSIINILNVTKREDIPKIINIKIDDKVLIPEFDKITNTIIVPSYTALSQKGNIPEHSLNLSLQSILHHEFGHAVLFNKFDKARTGYLKLNDAAIDAKSNYYLNESKALITYVLKKNTESEVVDKLLEEYNQISKIIDINEKSKKAIDFNTKIRVIEFSKFIEESINEMKKIKTNDINITIWEKKLKELQSQYSVTDINYEISLKKLINEMKLNGEYQNKQKFLNLLMTKDRTNYQRIGAIRDYSIAQEELLADLATVSTTGDPNIMSESIKALNKVKGRVLPPDKIPIEIESRNFNTNLSLSADEIMSEANYTYRPYLMLLESRKYIWRKYKQLIVDSNTKEDFLHALNEAIAKNIEKTIQKYTDNPNIKAQSYEEMTNEMNAVIDAAAGPFKIKYPNLF